MDLNLQNKIVVITGATGEIGSGICKSFIDEKAIVVPLYRNDEKLKDLMIFLGVNEENEFFYPIKTDILDSKQVNESLKNVYKKYKRIDVLVNCAGFVSEMPFLMLEEDKWNEQIDVNLNSAAKMIRSVARYMFKAKSGSIVNISSLMGHRFGRGVPAYAVAKAALDRLTEVLAHEFGPKNIRVNSVCPGLIETKMSKNTEHRLGESINELTPLRRIGQIDEVAKAVLFLASNSCSSFITGQKLFVDGGLGL
ncbi:MAG: SDR family oxidoreductase [Bacteroidota bacterium]|nr:SDR family oxidoreductase [Bacteroidota bacterium]